MLNVYFYMWHPDIKSVSLKMTSAAVKDTCIPQRLEMPSFMPPKHLAPTIYPTEVGVSSVCGREGETQMLSTAIKVTLDPQRDVKVRPSLSAAFFFNWRRPLISHCLSCFYLKEFLVALRLQGATMRHYMTQTNHSWHEQVGGFRMTVDSQNCFVVLQMKACLNCFFLEFFLDSFCAVCQINKERTY